MTTQPRTAEHNADETTPPDASTATQPKHRLGVAAIGAVVTVGIGAGLTALIIGVTGDTDTEVPSPGVPPSAEVPFDITDQNAREGIDRRLYELAEQNADVRRVPFDTTDPNALEGIDRRLYELAEQNAVSAELPFDTTDPNALEGIDRRLYELAERYDR